MGRERPPSSQRPCLSSDRAPLEPRQAEGDTPEVSREQRARHLGLEKPETAAMAA